MKDAINVKGVDFSYKEGEEKAIEDIDFRVKKGEWVAIMGPNGSGKSTLVKTIMCLERPQKGKIRVFGNDAMDEKEKIQGLIGYMPQKEHVSMKVPIKVKDIVLMGRGARKGAFKLISQRDIALAKKALEAVGLDNIWNKRFSDLSGGQQQRVLFSRALAVEPEILILDEPFNGVDVPSQNKMLDVIQELQENHGVTVIMVVHDVNPIIHYINKVLLLKKKVVSYGDPGDVLNQKNMMEAYDAVIPIVVCGEGHCHPILGDTHGR